MSRRSKLEKFEELNKMAHVYQNFSFKSPQLEYQAKLAPAMAGHWNALHFDREAPLCLELACGRGEYSIGLAKMDPDKNYIGLDIKGARIWKGARQALDLNLNNIAFLRTRIELIDHFFGKEEIDEIWITFPDPFLKSSKANRRLTSPYFLNLYQKILKPDHIIHLKTDSPELYQYTLDVIEEHDNIRISTNIQDIHGTSHNIPELDILTYYEHNHLAEGRTIYYLQFHFLKQSD